MAAPTSSPCVPRVVSVLAQVLLIGSLTLFWVQLLVRCWINAASRPTSVDSSSTRAGSSASTPPDPTAGALDADAGSFLRLSLNLFEGRHKSPKSSAEASDTWRGREVDGHLDSVQLVRVPQTGSRHLSTVARRLVGCPVKSSFVISGGPKCRFPGDPPLGCPDESLLCPKVIGFKDNAVDREVLADATVVSLSQLRSPVQRIISAFFVGGKPHSPPCAHRSGQTRREVQECFAGMIDSQGFCNVAGRTYTGHDAYDSGVSVCYSPRNSSSSGDGDEKYRGLEGDRGGAEGDGAEPKGLADGSGEDGGDAAGGDVGSDCQETLGAALAGLCLFNHITLAEAPATSALLLLETLPWIRPDHSFFEGLPPPAGRFEGGTYSRDRDAGTEHLQEARLDLLRHDDDGPGRVQCITQDLRDTASAANQARPHALVDQKLYDVVSAKMCFRLNELGLLEHPAVRAELGTSLLGERCASREWYEGVIDSIDGTIRTHPQESHERCRLFQPLPRPPSP
ncbi:unnamed protein product [Ectocarpus sp. 4 AP-2014]